MELILDIVKNNTSLGSKNKHKFNNSGGIIGRGEDVDFILEDSSSHISSNHLEIVYKDDGYFAKDISTNGTYLKVPYQKLEKNILFKIEEDMVFIIGEYELQARYFNNDYIDKDLIKNKQINRNIIPDDFSLDSDDEEDEEHIDTINKKSNVLDFIDIDEEEAISEEIQEEVNDVLSEHIILPSFEEKVKSVKEVVKDEKIEEVKKVEKIKEVKKVEKIEKPVKIEETVKLEKIEEVINKENTTHNEEEIIVEPIVKTISNLNEMEALSSLMVLEKKLGIEISTLTQYERDILLTEISDIVINSLEGLSKSLKIKDDIKTDILKSNRYNKNKDKPKEINPIKLGEISLNMISSNIKSKDQINISEAINKSFNEIDLHNLAMQQTTKNIINISSNKFSPKTLEYNFEKTGKIIPYIPKSIQMWTAYKKLFSKLDDDDTFGIEFIEKDFIKEYKNNSATINLAKI